MASDTPSARLREFVAAIAALVDAGPPEPELIRRGSALLGALVAVDDWLPEAFARPDPARYQQFLLHADARERFSVVSFVWGPGQSTPIHDHTVWGLIGMLRGAELAQAYARDAAGIWSPDGPAVLLHPGEVVAVSPRVGDVHRVTNALADRTSISIHVYGANIGAVRRSVYLEDGTRKGFISGYANAVLPNLWDRSAAAAPGGTPDATPGAAATPAAAATPGAAASPDTGAAGAPPATRAAADVRAALLDRRELALLDVREEDVYAQAHPLFAAHVPFSSLEPQVVARVPRRDVPIVLVDAGEGLAARAMARLQALGYTDVALLDGGLQGWQAAGFETFRDVNVPSKAFGEWVEAHRHTPSLAAEEVQALLAAQADVVVLDARRTDEYQVMNIPGSVSVPGAELLLRVRELAPDPRTRVIVNCAGRTRSIIGTQSLINAGIPNPVAALRNGTIGWMLAGQALENGAQRRFGDLTEARRAEAAPAARAVADRAGVRQAGLDDLARWRADPTRTLVLLDVRTPQEYEAGHLPGARCAPGGQLVQETDAYCPVRGARLVVVDTDGVRANMTASWLAQMGWDVHALSQVDASALTEHGRWDPPRAPLVDEVAWVSVARLRQWLDDAAHARAAALPAELAPPADAAAAGAVQAEAARRQAPAQGPHPTTVVLDLSPSAKYVDGHIPGAWFVLRSRLAQALAFAPPALRYVVTCPQGDASPFAAAEVAALSGQPVFVLDGGNRAWQASGARLERGDSRLASPRIDRYRRPYEGTGNPRAAMQAYLDWEFGLVAQLRRDGTHGFFVI